jgi:hypothetical protein
MADHREYTFKELRGVKVIEWRHIGGEAKTNKTIKKCRKQLKDKVGLENIDTPMMDLKQYGEELRYCDIILCTNNVFLWDQALKTRYSGRMDIRTIRAGHQLVILSADKSRVYVTVNVYHGTKKLMIQPGEYEENNLLAFFIGNTPYCVTTRCCSQTHGGYA